MGRDSRRGSADRRSHDVVANGRWRHPRPIGRRILPLLGRCAMDHPAFREDALRQRAVAGPVRGPGARDRRPAIRRRRPRHRRLAGARDARSRRRVLLEPRRRQRRRGGQVLRVDAGSGTRRRHAGGMGRRVAVFRTRPSAELRRPRMEPARDRAVEPVAAQLEFRFPTRKRVSPARVRRCSPRARSESGRDATTRY